MAESSDEHPSFEVIFPSEDASKPPENQETSLAIIDSQSLGGDVPENTKAISQLPSLRPITSKSSPHDPQPSTSNNNEEDSRSFIAIETEPSTSKPPTPRLSRNDDLLRSRFMRRHDADPFTGRSYHDFGYFNDSTHAFPGSQALPWNPINNFRQSYYPGYSPLVLPVPPMPPMPPTPVPTVSSSRPGHLPPSLFQIAPTVKPADDESGKLDGLYDHLASAEAMDGSSKSAKAAEGDINGPGSLSLDVYKSTQAETEAGGSKSRDVETLLEALKAEREKSRKLEMELQIKRELEAEHDQRLARIEAKNDSLQRELAGQKQTQEDALARLEGQNRHQEKLHKDQFDKLQQIMDKFGDHMTMMEQHENNRLAEQRRQEEEEEAKKREDEMNQQEDLEEHEREEQLWIEEQLKMEKKERLEEERQQEEEKRRAQEQEKEENQRSEERIHQMAEMIFQKLREDWAQKEAAEAQRRAEEERRKLEQEEKERREREERERLAEKIRLEKEQRIREAERKQREEDEKHAAEEQARKQIDEEVERNLTAKLKAEIERLQSDLRRHTQGARPDLTNGRGLTQPNLEPVFDQEQLDWDPTWKFPPSNPFSRNRRRIRSHHHHEPLALEDSRRLLQFEAGHPFGSPQGQTRPASDRPANQPSYFGETGQTQQSAASTPAPVGVYSQYGEDSVYEDDEGGVSSQNPWTQVQTTRSHGSSRSIQVDAQSNAGSTSAFTNRNAFNDMEIPGQYPSERYASDVNAANNRNFQYTSHPHNIDRTGTPSASSQNGFGQDVGETYMNENDPMAYAMYLVEDTAQTSESSPIQDWNGLHETKPRGYPQANGRLGTPRPHNHRTSLEPPSAPSPPTQQSPRSASGRSSRQTPTLNGNRIFSSGRGTVEGFPPPPSTAPSSPPIVQYLPLEQVKALTASKNLPVIMMPVVPLYSIQFAELDEQTDAGEAKDGETEGEEEEEEEEEQAESANPFLVNGQ